MLSMITLPPSSAGRSVPSSVMMGISELRMAYLKTTIFSENP